MPVRRLVLIRHGETDGESSVRLHGSTDVDLSEEGRAQMRRMGSALGAAPFDLVVASPLRRSWRGAWLVGRGSPVQLVSDLREIDFGRWEGKSREECQATDPTLYEDWKPENENFGFPGGESRPDFRARVGAALSELLASDAPAVLGVLHKGVIREIVRQLTGQPLPDDEPAIGASITLTRGSDGNWFHGQRGSNPPGLEADAAA